MWPLGLLLMSCLVYHELVVEFHQFLSHNLLNLTACADKKNSVCLWYSKFSFTAIMVRQ